MVLEILGSTGVTLLLALVFVQYTGIKKKIEKQVPLVAASALSFILADVLGDVTLFGTEASMVAVKTGLVSLFSFIGVVALLVGSVWAIHNLLLKK